MHVKLTIAIPLFSSHEKSQGVLTRRMVANRNGNPIPEATADFGVNTFTSLILDNLQYGDKIDLSMRDVDQAGNVSEAALDGAFVLTDTIAPDGPVGSFNYQLEEVADPDDTTAPATTPPAAPPVQPAVQPATTPPAGDASSPLSGQGF